jgi:DNA-binding protein H-NS
MNLKSLNLAELSIDELSELYDQVQRVLAQKIEQEKRKLEEQLARLGSPHGSASGRFALERRRQSRKTRRPYPPVRPKFRNPANPSETWAGRGKQPRWLVSQLKAGKKLDDFLIKHKVGTAAKKRAQD